MKSNNNYVLKVGETAKVKPAFFKSAESIVYAGMINDLTFSVVVTWTFGYNSMAYNLFIPKDKKEFYTQKGRVQVEYVSVEEMRFTYQQT